MKPAGAEAAEKQPFIKSGPLMCKKKKNIEIRAKTQTKGSLFLLCKS